MFSAQIIQTLGKILIVLIMVFIVKNYLINLLESKKTYKNIVMMALCLTILLSSIVFMASGFDLEQASSNSINSTRKSHLETRIIYLGIVDIIAITCLIALYINIKHEVKLDAKAKENRWDWRKIS